MKFMWKLLDLSFLLLSCFKFFTNVWTLKLSRKKSKYLHLKENVQHTNAIKIQKKSRFYDIVGQQQIQRKIEI